MGGRKRTWTDAELIAACRSEPTVADVIRVLGLRQGGGTHQLVRHHMTRLGIELARPDPQAWMRKPGAHPGGRTMPLEEALTSPSPYFNIGKLRQRLVNAGLKSLQCERCGITDWLGDRLPFELDHIDGDRTNNRLENLRMLCPNCHAQTESWCRKRSSRPT